MSTRRPYRKACSSVSRFRLSWYAPIDFSYLKDRRAPVKSRCDGSPLGPDERMVRIDARTSAAQIDWNANDVIETELFAQDVNFSGTMNGTGAGAVSGPLKGFSDDWSNLKLNQVGARRNVGGLYRLADGTLAVGPLSLHLGKVDLSPSDMGKVDLELGKVDLFAGKVDLDFGQGGPRLRQGGPEPRQGRSQRRRQGRPRQGGSRSRRRRERQRRHRPR